MASSDRPSIVAARVARGSPPCEASSRATVSSTWVLCSSVISPRSTIRSASGRVGSEAQAAQVSARPSASTAPLWNATTPKSKLRSVSMATSPSVRNGPGFAGGTRKGPGFPSRTR